MASLACKSCGNEMVVPDDYVGRVRCRRCGKVAGVHAPEAATVSRDGVLPLEEPNQLRWALSIGVCTGGVITQQVLKALSNPLPSDVSLILVGLAGACITVLGAMFRHYRRLIAGTVILWAGITIVAVALGSWYGRDAALRNHPAQAHLTQGPP